MWMFKQNNNYDRRENNNLKTNDINISCTLIYAIMRICAYLYMKERSMLMFDNLLIH